MNPGARALTPEEQRKQADRIAALSAAERQLARASARQKWAEVEIEKYSPFQCNRRARLGAHIQALGTTVSMRTRTKDVCYLLLNSFMNLIDISEQSQAPAQQVAQQHRNTDLQNNLPIFSSQSEAPREEMSSNLYPRQRE